MRRHRGLAEPLQDQLQFAGVRRHVTDCEHARCAGLAGRGFDFDVVRRLLQPPGGDGAEVHGQAEERQQHVGRQVFGPAFERCDLHRGQRAVGPVQSVQLVGDDHLHLTSFHRRVELRCAFRRRPELGPAMHHGHVGNVLQRKRPVDGRVATARDHHALAAERLPLFDVILHCTRCLIGRQPVQRRAVRPKRAGPRRHDHRFGTHNVAPIGGQHEGAGLAGQAFHPPPQKPRCRERRDLLFQSRDQIARIDRGVGRDVVDRFLGVQRRALSTDICQRVDQHAC